MKFNFKQNKIVYQDNLAHELAVIEYQPKNGDNTIWKITRTFVDPQLRGQGIAQKLLSQLVTLAIANNKKLDPICSYAVAAFARDPKLQALQAK